jgi:uncharacterized protein DUF839
MSVLIGCLGLSVAVQADTGGGHIAPGLADANPRVGTQPTRIVDGFALVAVARGSDPLENPSGIITSYGFLDDAAVQPVERTQTVPDENTYLVLDHDPGGPTAGYDYGRHFLFQGHENRFPNAYVTRVNLDVADPAHRITLLTPVGPDGHTGFGEIDGSTFDPFTGTLLFAQEPAVGGGVIEVSVDWPPRVRTLYGTIGHGSYEGVHPDKLGRILIMEDMGGAKVNVVPGDPTSPKQARQPNSFVFRYVPDQAGDLAAGGRLEALQVQIDGQPITFHASDPVGDTFATAQLELHTPGTSWPCRFITVHDTAVDGFADFDANAAAKAAGATPFKRPENAQYQPGSDFGTFFFAPTGDTNADAGNQPALAARGAWGAIFRADLDAAGEEGIISLVVLGDRDHTSFDNLAFVDRDTLLVAEDRGDVLHRQIAILDSVWAYSLRGPDVSVSRFIALGRDPVSLNTANLGDAGTPGLQNDGDNEPTGLHVSSGATDLLHMQGTMLDQGHVRWFFTQQHGEDVTYEILWQPQP